MMDNIREKLVELLRYADDSCFNTGCMECSYMKRGRRCKAHFYADILIANGVTVQEWIPVSEPPEVWRKENGDMVNYLIYVPEFGVDIGNYAEPAKYWLCMGVPCKPTHWAHLPQPRKESELSVTGRNLVAVSIKHTEYKWKFGMPCVLWGHRTKDEEKRSFGGYTQYPNNAEVYSLEDWQKSGYAHAEWMKVDEPVQMCIDFCKKYKQYDTVLVTLEQYIMYCKAACLPLDRPKGEWR